ncbi:neutral zinc metallopeptidase [Streptomyces noboritoensis]|uniref:Neutral zinc metallopeptidase n=1 Tax=Streptomyces noboritoensis TaxID=67337 RepID=A0ABV6TGF6_9ACTN
MALHRSTRSRPVAVAIGVLLALVSVAGCSDGGLPKQGTAPVNQGGQRGGADDAWMTEARDAVQVVDDFWRSHWNQHFTGAYGSPKVFGTYTPNTPQAPRCGSEPATPYNAFYCPAGDFIAWDGKLMRDGYAQGDSWVYLVIAHEWGHAVQRRVLGLKDVAQELQADCLAGATLFGSEELRFEPGDTDELAQALTALADESPWTNSQDHGNADQRLSAFSTGGRGGVNACLPR